MTVEITKPVAGEAISNAEHYKLLVEDVRAVSDTRDRASTGNRL
jgi:hypothetical protein